MHGVAVGQRQCRARPSGHRRHADCPAHASHAATADRPCARLCSQVLSGCCPGAPQLVF